MAKRFTDTDKWKKPFIRSLDAPYKLLWFYILDDCNHAGIWEVDMEVASLRIGHQVTVKIALEKFGDRVQKVSEAKWFLADFIFFQYGELNEKNRLHLSVIQILNKYAIKPLRSPLEGVKDKDKEQDKVKDMDKDKVFGKSENLLNEKFLVPQMCKIWYQTFAAYTTDKWNDFEGMGKILQFISRQAGLKNIPGPEEEIKILNTLQLIADEVGRDGFWVNKPIKSIANNIQEFYNKLKNPQQNGKQSATSAANFRSKVQAERDKRREASQQEGN